MIAELRVVQARAAFPQGGRDRRAERAGGDPREIEQSRSGGDPVRRQPGKGKRDQRNEKHSHRRALHERGNEERGKIGVGVEVRAHHQHHGEDGERNGGKHARIDLVNGLADEWRKQDRQDSDRRQHHAGLRCGVAHVLLQP